MLCVPFRSLLLRTHWSGLRVFSTRKGSIASASSPNWVLGSVRSIRGFCRDSKNSDNSGANGSGLRPPQGREDVRTPYHLRNLHESQDQTMTNVDKLDVEESAGVSSTTEELREELRLQELINAEVQKRADLGFSSTPDLQEHLRMQEQINAELRKQADLEARRLEGASKTQAVLEEVSVLAAKLDQGGDITSLDEGNRLKTRLEELRQQHFYHQEIAANSMKARDAGIQAKDAEQTRNRAINSSLAVASQLKELVDELQKSSSLEFDGATMERLKELRKLAQDIKKEESSALSFAMEAKRVAEQRLSTTKAAEAAARREIQTANEASQIWDDTLLKVEKAEAASHAFAENRKGVPLYDQQRWIDVVNRAANREVLLLDVKKAEVQKEEAKQEAMKMAAERDIAIMQKLSQNQLSSFPDEVNVVLPEWLGRTKNANHNRNGGRHPLDSDFSELGNNISDDDSSDFSNGAGSGGGGGGSGSSSSSSGSSSSSSSSGSGSGNGTTEEPGWSKAMNRMVMVMAGGVIIGAIVLAGVLDDYLGGSSSDGTLVTPQLTVPNDGGSVGSITGDAATLLQVGKLVVREASKAQVRDATALQDKKETVKRDSAQLMRAEQQKQFEEREKLRIENELKLLKAKGAMKAAEQNEKLRLEAQVERQNEDVRARARQQQGKLDHQKAVAVARETLSAVGQGVKSVLTDSQQLTALVGSVAVLIVAAFSAREAAKLTRQRAAAVLGKPSLVRETSRASLLAPRHAAGTMISRLGSVRSVEQNFNDVVLEQKLTQRVISFARATKNTRKNKADFRHLCLYGPPGTGKTLVAKKLARFSGLDYAIMSGGDVLPLGADGVTEIHALFDWAKQSKRGVLLFIDEAEAFLAQRSSDMSEHQRNALNALLFQTGTQSRHFMMVLATNRPADLDSAVLDRMDEMIEFPLPTFWERQKLLNLFFDQTLNRPPRPGQTPIRLEGIGHGELVWLAGKTEGYSGRLLSKLMISVQGHVFGQEQPTLCASKFKDIVEMKLESMDKRRKLLEVQEAYGFVD